MTRFICRVTGHRLVIFVHRCEPEQPCRPYSHAKACWCGERQVIWPVR